ncbi:ABC transporter substrate-binding protein [Pusillimonas noertemannii]|uniref:ABC transporter substrate-binding protein n=1 Tax=Pusillimonas noertemannii TaxID=305977 RepID=UPI0003105612|nr:extracellular solute-binding protein [Pusillimonas noertemannii]
MKKIALLLFTCLAMGGACAQAPGNLAKLAAYQGPDREQMLIDGARKEGGLTLYTSQQLDDTNLVVQAFEKKYGLKVKVWRSGPDSIVPRIINETASQRYAYDVVETEGQALEALQTEGLLQAVKSPHLQELVPQALRPHGEWVGTRLLIFSQAYNTDLIKKEDLPKTYQDLADPKWKGKLGIETKDEEWFYSLMQKMGQEDGLALFRKIGETNGFSVRKGHTLLTNLVASGEVPLALTVYNARVEQLKNKGAPIDWFVMQPTLAQVNGAGVSRHAPNPHAALLFMDFLLTESQRILSKRDVIATNKNCPSPLSDFPFETTDPAKLIGQGDKWVRIYQDVINTQPR